MADFEKAYQFMIRNEVVCYGDDRCIYYSFHPLDPGGPTAWGITERMARKHGYEGDMIDMPESKAKEIYIDEFWRYGGLLDQRVASKLFDMAVNMGPERAAKLAQSVAGTVTDGVYGRKTEAALNALPGGVAINNLCLEQTNFYNAIVTKKPSSQVFLKGWLRRARKIPEA